MPSQRVTWTNSADISLTGVLELPLQKPTAFAVWAHCFTCSKDLKATVRVSRNLAEAGIAVLRFDFTGIGHSGGNFEESNFESNVADLKSAIHWLTEDHQSPELLIGHSLGGAAAMAVAAEASQASGGPLANVKCLATLAAPSCTAHLGEFLLSQNASIATTGRGEVSIGGRAWPITSQLIDSLRNRDLSDELARITLPHLILHSPDDQTVKWHHALRLLESGPHKSLITLADSDHLLLRQSHDVQYVADVIASWSQPYLSAGFSTNR